MQKPFHLLGEYLIVDKLNSYALLLVSIVAIGVSLSLLTLFKHVKIQEREYHRFYRFFAIFWIGLIMSILANHMGIFWIGLELATLSTVYMIKTNKTKNASTEAWNYMLVGAIGVSLVLFGIILMYASAKPILGEDAMNFSALIQHAKEISNPFLFEMGFAISAVGIFVKMGFFPMNLWLANIERAAFYPVAALFSGMLETAVIMGFFRFSDIAKQVNYGHLFGFTMVYAIITIFVVSFLIFRAKDFIRLFALSGIEHMALIAIFWVSGGTFAALLHLGAHAFIKPSLFLATGILESDGKYNFMGALKGYHGAKGKIFWFLVGLFMLAIISLPPSPMFFSEIYGFSAMMSFVKGSDYFLLMLFAVVILLLLLSIIFYKFVNVYQSMKYEGKEREKKVYFGEIIALILFASSLVLLMLPTSLAYLRSIA
jgi:hydrogenase-4 component F